MTDSALQAQIDAATADVIIRVNPALTADQLFTFYQRNDICEVGFDYLHSPWSAKPAQ